MFELDYPDYVTFCDEAFEDVELLNKRLKECKAVKIKMVDEDKQDLLKDLLLGDLTEKEAICFDTTDSNWSDSAHEYILGYFGQIVIQNKCRALHIRTVTPYQMGFLFNLLSANVSITTLHVTSFKCYSSAWQRFTNSNNTIYDYKGDSLDWDRLNKKWFTRKFVPWKEKSAKLVCLTKKLIPPDLERLIVNYTYDEPEVEPDDF